MLEQSISPVRTRAPAEKKATRPIRLIVGLGNPGTEYQGSRHNAGFDWVERAAEVEDTPLAVEKRFLCLLARRPGAVARSDESADERLGEGMGQRWLMQPLTYMNRSGQAVQAFIRMYRLQPDEILVVHDELDLPPGALKLKQGGGNAGHNGLKSIHAALGTGDFWRLRIGIGHPRERGWAQPVADYVLQRPSAADRILIETTCEASLALLPDLWAGRFEQAHQLLARKP